MTSSTDEGSTNRSNPATGNPCQSLISASLLLVAGVTLMLLKPALFPVSSGLFSASLAYFLHLFLGGLDQGSLDVDAASDSALSKVAKIALKAKVAGPVAIFFLTWGALNALDYSRSGSLQVEQRIQQLINDPKHNELEMIPEMSPSGEPVFRIKMNKADLGVVTSANLHGSLETLAISAAKQRKDNKLTSDILVECSSLTGVCTMPTAFPVKVSFLEKLGPNRALVCPNSPILAITKLSGNDVMLTRFFNKPDKPVEVYAANIDQVDGPSPCQEAPNWIAIDRNHYRDSFGSDKDGLVDGFLYSIKKRSGHDQ